MHQVAVPVVLFSALTGLPLAAQPAEPAPAAYRVEVVLSEAGTTQRRYVVVAGAQGNAGFRLSHPIFCETGPAGDPLRHQYQFTERSLFLNCEVRSLSEPGKVRLTLLLNVQNLERDANPPGPEAPPPRRPTTSIRVDAPVALGTRTSVASIDDPVLPRRCGVEVAVTRMQ